MKYLSDQMIRIMERLSEMFPDTNYQSRLDAYLSTKGITDAAQLENYIQQFNYSHKEKNIWKQLKTFSLLLQKQSLRPVKPKQI